MAAGEVRSRGFDLSVAGYLAPGWRVIGTYTHADAAVSRDNTLPVGTRIANIPANTLAVQSVYEFQAGALRGLGLGGGLTYVGQRVAGTALSSFRLPEYTTLNLISYYWITQACESTSTSTTCSTRPSTTAPFKTATPHRAYRARSWAVSQHAFDLYRRQNGEAAADHPSVRCPRPL